MKKNLFSTIAVTVLLASCGGDSDYSNLQLEKLKTTRDSLKGELALVNEQIALLDTTAEEVIPLVTTTPVLLKDFVHKVEVQGAVETDMNALVNSEASGLIDKIHIREGQKVSAGQALITIDSDILASNIDELETSLDLANYMYEKQKKLMDEGVGVEIEYEQALNQKKALEKKLKTLKTQQGKTVVRAPFSGVVDDIMVHVGEIAAPQFPLLRIVNNDNVTVSASLSESLLGSIKEGSKVDLLIPSLNDTVIHSTITSKGNYVDPTNRTFKILMDIRNNKVLLPNQLAKVSVTDFVRDSSLVVPSESILQDTKNRNFLYKMIDPLDGTYALEKVFVTVVKRYKGESCIIPENGKSINPEDMIVLGGAKGITQSDRVKIQ